MKWLLLIPVVLWVIHQLKLIQFSREWEEEKKAFKDHRAKDIVDDEWIDVTLEKLQDEDE